MESVQFLTAPPVVYGSIKGKPSITEAEMCKFKYSRVLIAENDKRDASIILSILERMKIDYTITENVLSTLKETIEFGNYYDILFVNQYLPEKGAKDLVESIRSDSRFENMPIVIMIELGDKEPINLIKAGANGFVEKPLMGDKVYGAFDIFVGDKSTYILKIDDGLSHTNDNQELYILLLEDFVQQYSESDRTIIQYLYREDYEKLGELIVDIEGLSGTIGALLLHKITQMMLEGYRNKSYYELSSLLPIYKNELQKVLNAINDFLSSQKSN